MYNNNTDHTDGMIGQRRGFSTPYNRSDFPLIQACLQHKQVNVLPTIKITAKLNRTKANIANMLEDTLDKVIELVPAVGPLLTYADDLILTELLNSFIDTFVEVNENCLLHEMVVAYTISRGIFSEDELCTVYNMVSAEIYRIKNNVPKSQRHPCFNSFLRTFEAFHFSMTNTSGL